MNVDSVKRMMAPLARRVRMIAGRGAVDSSDDSGAVQLLKLSGLDGEVFAQVARVQQFGFTSRMPNGASVTFLCMGGSRNYPVVIAADDASRLNDLPLGASAIYDAAGNYFRFNADGTWYLKATTSGVVDCPQVEFKGNATIDGNVIVKGTLEVDGNAELKANLQVDGNESVTGITTGSGAATFAGGVSDGTGALGHLRSQYDLHYHGGIQRGGDVSDGPAAGTGA